MLVNTALNFWLWNHQVILASGLEVLTFDIFDNVDFLDSLTVWNAGMLEDSLAARTQESARFLIYDADQIKLHSDLHIRALACDHRDLGFVPFCLKYILVLWLKAANTMLYCTRRRLIVCGSHWTCCESEPYSFLNSSGLSHKFSLKWGLQACRNFASKYILVVEYWAANTMLYCNRRRLIVWDNDWTCRESEPSMNLILPTLCLSTTFSSQGRASSTQEFYNWPSPPSPIYQLTCSKSFPVLGLQRCFSGALSLGAAFLGMRGLRIWTEFVILTENLTRIWVDPEHISRVIKRTFLYCTHWTKQKFCLSLPRHHLQLARDM
jgi:hypothetical protein